MIYTPVKGSILTAEQAQKYGSHIAVLIEENNGSIIAAQIVDDAKKKTSPLNDYFEWNDKRAANRWRLRQAAHLLRSIQVMIKDDEGMETETRAFHNVTIDDSYAMEPERVNVTVQRVLSEDNLREQIIDKALKQLDAWRKKYKQYKEFTEIVSVIDELLTG
jgi:hypothetical protein